MTNTSRKTPATAESLTLAKPDPLPAVGFVRIWHVVGDKKRGIPPLIPIGRTSFFAGIKSGRYKVTPIKLGNRTTVFRVEEIRALIDELGAV